MATQLLQQALPNLDYPILSYISSLFSSSDADPADDPISTFIRPLLESETVHPVPEADIERICSELAKMWEKLTGAEADVGAAGKGPAKLDQALDMRRQELKSKRQAVTQVVDIASVVKARETQVNLKALEKAEAKLKAKLEKRNARNLYEGSKLMEAQKSKKSYEELFLEVNPLQVAGANKGKSKDIHLENIDVSLRLLGRVARNVCTDMRLSFQVSFGSLRILSNATLTLPYGRRMGLVGRNGIGKSTLLRAMALREVAIPQHISILYVQQEVIGDDTPALESVLQADVHRTRLMAEEKELNASLESLEKEAEDLAKAGGSGETEEQEKKHAELRKLERKKDDAMARLGEVQKLLVEIEADSGPSRAGELLAGLGFSTSDQSMPTKAFSGGWRMRLSLARALFCKPDLLLLDEPSNNLDLNALAWLEDYLQTWPSTLLVVSHDRAFLNAVATDIVHQHNERLDYYKGNFAQFYATKSERQKQQKREYETQLQYRQHLQAFIDRWRCMSHSLVPRPSSPRSSTHNANRAAQAQMKIKILEKLPELTPPEEDDVVTFKFPETDKISPPLLQLSEVSFGYTKDKLLLKGVNIDVGLDSRIGLIGANGAGKSTMLKLLIGELTPTTGQQTRNGRLRIAYFAQHHIDSLDLTVNSVAYLQRLFPGLTEQQYRSHLGAFGITGMTSLQLIGTLSGGQKSRVSFAVLSMQRPHVLLLDEPTNHLDLEGLDALMDALKKWNGGGAVFGSPSRFLLIVISHDSTFLHTVCDQLWVCGDQKVEKFYGDVTEYKNIIVGNSKKMTPT
ncbi:SPOSA6832_02450 [Sporobolomyces salmonicolor]|uniref:SPOSA6832_02450-mRNA-1:cds n=1 Tax=Sporidiobolus salmonicolor TaxID=5005 RepID=A0A0D6ELM2_SPOSA|nr:SPOSA6832_02450 [Sporobolomyces salmonicolor]